MLKTILLWRNSESLGVCRRPKFKETEAKDGLSFITICIPAFFVATAKDVIAQKSLNDWKLFCELRIFTIENS